MSLDPLTITTRPATSDDLVVLEELYALSRAGISGERGAEIDTAFRGRTGDLVESFRADMNAPDTWVLVGSVDDVVLSYAVVTLLRPNGFGPLIEVSDLFVMEPARGVGIGAALMAEVNAIAERLNCVGVTARALPGDRSTKNFFESLGMVARSIEVYRDLR